MMPSSNFLISCGKMPGKEVDRPPENEKDNAEKKYHKHYQFKILQAHLMHDLIYHQIPAMIATCKCVVLGVKIL